MNGMDQVESRVGRRPRECANQSSSLKVFMDTLEVLVGGSPARPPYGMTKRRWDYVKGHRLATK